jgi:hypothetical protein
MTFPSFLLPVFAWAGVGAALGAVAIHLLNRRRYRVLPWAAMDFLRQAIHRNRRILQLRDLLLLLLRVACLMAFGAALARPYLTRSAAALAAANQPVHAVVLVDNSLSTSYQKLDGAPLLDDVKTEAKKIIEDLPRGSRISVVAVCGSSAGVNYEACYTPQEAAEALAAIQPVDRAARPAALVDQALSACQQLATMPVKQIYLVTDQQAAQWPGEGLVDHLRQLPGPMRIVQVAPDLVENAWIADLKIRDGMADAQSSTIFLATIGYQGRNARHGVEVTLAIDGVTVATQRVDLQPNQMREIQFPPHRLDVPAEPGKPAYVTAEVSLPQDLDRLPADNKRFLVVPVMAALPVVFVDQYGPDEDPKLSRYGETYWLRRLLAPAGKRTAAERPLIQVRHLKMSQLTRETLADARLVVVAGVASPQGATTLLREYVQQGGNLILAAGGQFDPVAWNEAAWSDGLGILPAPLRAATVGHRRDESGSAKPFLLDFESLVHEYFWPEGSTEEELRALFGPPTMFFKAVAVDADEKVAEHVAGTVAKHLAEEKQALAEIDAKTAEIDKQLQGLRAAADGPAGERSQLEQQHADLERQRTALRPDWLVWKKQQAEESEPAIEELVQRAQPTVMARFDKDGLPFLVRRSWGRGQVLFIATSLSPYWNTMPNVRQSWWLLDRIVHSLLVATLPPRNLSTERSTIFPVAPIERSARFTLTDAAGQQQALTVDALGGDRYGLTLGNWTRRGLYRLAALRSQDRAQEAKLWDVPLAVNGPAEESQLSPGEGGQIRGGRSFLEVAQSVSGNIPLLEGRDLWKWMIGLVLVGLIGELGLRAWFGGRERNP